LEIPFLISLIWTLAGLKTNGLKNNTYDKSNQMITRRKLLQNSAAVATGVLLPKVKCAAGFKAANDRPMMAAIGTGSRWYQKATGLNGTYGSAPEMQKYGDYVAVCDADEARVNLAGEIVKEWTKVAPSVQADYRRILDRDDIDIVHI
jgi:hypothetical protein